MDEEFICSNLDIIDHEIEILESKLEELYDKKTKLQELCSHNLVFRIKDDRLYKVGSLYNYVCPICNLNRRLNEYNIDESPFSNSKIIDIDFKKEKILSK